MLTSKDSKLTQNVYRKLVGWRCFAPACNASTGIWLVVGARCSFGSDEFLFSKPPQGTPGDLKREGKSGAGLVVLRFDPGAEFPEESGEFTGNRDFCLVVVELAQRAGTMAFV